MPADELGRLTIISGLRSSVSLSVSSQHLSLGGRHMPGGERLVRIQTAGAGDGQCPVTVQHLFPLSLLPPGWRTRGCLCAGTPRQPGPRGPSCPLPCTPEMTVCTLRAARLLYTLTSTHPHLYTHSPPRPEPGSWGSQIRNFGADFPLENVINNLHTVCLMSLQTNE